jgi:hypothetical protein
MRAVDEIKAKNREEYRGLTGGAMAFGDALQFEPDRM